MPSTYPRLTGSFSLGYSPVLERAVMSPERSRLPRISCPVCDVGTVLIGCHADTFRRNFRPIHLHWPERGMKVQASAADSSIESTID